MHRLYGLLLVAAVSCFSAPADTHLDGKALFDAHCALCHKPGAENRTPPPDALKRLTNESILASLETGVMKSQGLVLSPADRGAIADFLVPKSSGPAEITGANQCAGKLPPP